MANNDSIEMPDHVSFDYIKSPNHREVMVDGVHGGLTPNGRIQMSLYCERHAIPKKTVHKIEPTGELGDEIKSERITRDSIIRSVETTLLMDIETAMGLRNWLERQIKTHQEIQKKIMPEPKK